MGTFVRKLNKFEEAVVAFSLLAIAVLTFVETVLRYTVYGIIMIVNIECGFLTRPFGLNLFVSMAIMKKSLIEIGRAVLPFILLFFFCLLVIAYVTKLSLILPELLLGK